MASVAVSAGSGDGCSRVGGSWRGHRALAAAAGGARRATVSGEASIKRETAEQWHPATEGDALRPGDALKTGPDSTLLAKFRDGSSLDLAADTELILDAESEGAKRPIKAKLTLGNILAVITPGSGVFEVEAALAVASVQGTQFGLQATEPKAVLTVLSGEVAFWNDLGSVTAKAMERSVAVPGHAPTEPHRLAGYHGGGWKSKVSLHDGGYLQADPRAHTTSDVRRAYEQLGARPETSAALEQALGPLWHGAGGVHVSLDWARELAQRSVRLTDLRRADLGVVHPLTKEEGVVGVPILEVLEGSPAEAAGLREDDVIVSVNGQPVDDEVQVMDELWRAQSESQLEVAFMRDGQRQTVGVTSGAAEPTPQEFALIAACRLLTTQPRHVAARIVVAHAQACLGQVSEARAGGPTGTRHPRLPVARRGGRRSHCRNGQSLGAETGPMDLFRSCPLLRPARRGRGPRGTLGQGRQGRSAEFHWVGRVHLGFPGRASMRQRRAREGPGVLPEGSRARTGVG